MAAIQPIEETARRWGSGMLQHGLDTWAGYPTLANVKKVLWMVAPQLRIINRRAKNTATVTIPTAVMKHLRVELGDYIEFVPRRNGEVVVRKANERKLRNALKRFEWVHYLIETGQANEILKP